MPLDHHAIDAFIQIELPESLRERSTFRPGTSRMDRLGDIFSGERSFETQTELYHGIRDGFGYLAQKMGEEHLFVGPPDAQTAAPHFVLPGLIPIYDLKSAEAAIQVIVEQGEGASLESEHSHYARFLSVRKEYDAILAEDPDFVPGRPVVANPVVGPIAELPLANLMNPIEDPFSADFCNLFDGCYELMVQMLARLFVHAEESGDDLAALADITVGLMMDVLLPLGNALTKLPAGPSYPGKTAGPSFRLSRGASVPTHRTSAWPVFRERLNELAVYCRFLQAEPHAPTAVLAATREALDSFSGKLAEAVPAA
jgi:hypothetical protein